jgi:ABC-type antimicrobial peptide transport system permease subunit
MMLALGFTRRRVVRMVLLENVFLLAAGLVIGTAAALLAAAPQLVSTVADVQWMSLAATLGAALAVGALSCALAARLSVHGRLVEALRSE